MFVIHPNTINMIHVNHIYHRLPSERSRDWDTQRLCNLLICEIEPILETSPPEDFRRWCIYTEGHNPAE